MPLGLKSYSDVNLSILVRTVIKIFAYRFIVFDYNSFGISNMYYYWKINLELNVYKNDRYF